MNVFAMVAAGIGAFSLFNYLKYKFDSMEHFIDAQRKEIQNLNASLNSNFNKISEKVDHFLQKPKKEPVSKKRGSNRRPRTEEQKRIASEKKRLWWEEKKRKQSQAS